MKLIFPRSGATLIQGKVSPVSREWGHWFRGLSASLGFSTSAPMYSEIINDPRAMTAGGIGVSDSIIVGLLTVKSFDATNNAIMRSAFVLPNNYREGSDLSPFVEWCPTDATAGNIVFELIYSVTRNGVVFPATTTGAKTVAAPESDNMLQRAEFTAIDGDDFKRGDTVLVSIGRKGADAADTYAAASGIVSLGFKYEAATVGHEEKFA